MLRTFLFSWFILLASALSAQNILINEKWLEFPPSASILFNSGTRQFAVVTPGPDFVRVTYSPQGKWNKSEYSARIPSSVIGSMKPASIKGDTIYFVGQDGGSVRRWMAYNLATQFYVSRLKGFPFPPRQFYNEGYFGFEENIYSGEKVEKWVSLDSPKFVDVPAAIPTSSSWKSVVGEKWLFVSPAPNSMSSKSLNFLDADNTITPLPFPINNDEKEMGAAHWINTDSVLVTERNGGTMSLRLYALASQVLVKGNTNRLKIGNYTMLYETWEDTIPTIELDSVQVISSNLSVIPAPSADKQQRKLGNGRFSALFGTFSDPSQAYSFLNRIINILPGAYASNADTGIVILGPRRTTYDAVKADSSLLADVDPSLAPKGIIGFADQLKERDETVVSLYVLDRMTYMPLPVQITFFNRLEDEMIFMDSARTGQLSFIYSQGDELGMIITARGYAPKSIRIDSNKDSIPTYYHQDILMEPLAPLFMGEYGPSSMGQNASMDFNNVLFDFDSDIPRKVSAGELKAMADLILQTNPSRVEIIGHTDDVGTDGYNQRLGLRRAKAVCAELVKFGVKKSILVPISKGEKEPVVANDSDFNRSLNRRVTLGDY